MVEDQRTAVEWGRRGGGGRIEVEVREVHQGVEVEEDQGREMEQVVEVVEEEVMVREVEQKG